MKKFYALFISFVLLFLQTNIVFAETKNCYIDELGVYIEVPDDFYVFTRGMDRNDPLFYEFGVDPDEFEDGLVETDTYLFALSPDGLYQIEVNTKDVGYNDFRYIPDSVLQIEANRFEEEAKNIGAEFIDKGVCYNKQSKYIKTHIVSKEYGIRYIQYITSINDITYFINIRTYEDDFSDEMFIYSNDVLESFTFESEPLLEDLWEKTEAFVYTSDFSGASFTVPSDYKLGDVERSTSDEGETEIARFVSTHDTGVAITHGCIDLYDTTDTGFYGYERSEIDFSMLTEEDFIKEIDGAKDVEIVNIGNESYYKINLEESVDLEGDTITAEMVCFTTLKDGWLHYYMLIGNEESPYYNDLIELLESVEYPYIANESSIITLPRLIIAAVILISYLIKRKIKPKKKLTVTDDQFKDQNDSSNLTAEENRCPECGALLLTGSERCYKCGKDINKV
ncbi:MAG: hypothetical protein IJF29_05500 [Firmicutes bacterium]|nr:hypothetical protein [Bacillota bacterium]